MLRTLSLIFSVVFSSLFLVVLIANGEEAAVPVLPGSSPMEAHVPAAAAPVDTHATAPAEKHAASASGHHDDVKSVHPQIAYGWLRNGNTRFLTKRFRADGKSSGDRKRLNEGQHPHSIVFSCADSRVPPELVFDQVLGEIFTVRNAGEVPDFASVASIEYAIEHLGSRLVLVMGHTKCGAVKATLDTPVGGSVGSLSLDKLVADIHPRVGDVSNENRSPDLATESFKNARAVARDLLVRSEILKKAFDAKKIEIRPALYHLDTGKVDFDDALK